MPTVVEKDILYTLYPNNGSPFYLVGTNSSTAPNAVANIYIPRGVIRIPCSLKGVPVLEIGSNAFNDCLFITSLVIEEGITMIHTRAFDDCGSIESVYIPSTVQYLGDICIVMNHNSFGPTPGITRIYICGQSKLKYLGFLSFGYRANIEIYICSSVLPTYNANVFQKVGNLTVYSPSSFSFCNVMTTHIDKSFWFIPPEHTIHIRTCYCRCVLDITSLIALVQVAIYQ